MNILKSIVVLIRIINIFMLDILIYKINNYLINYLLIMKDINIT
mgnify:CR=1 FL=1